ncbi:hypothetical protein BH11ARM1_BH11ARM1_10650 [soil metagenome]
MDFVLQSFAQAQPRTTADIINDLARTPLSQVVIFITVLTVLRLLMYPKLMKTPVHMRSGAFGIFRVGNEIADAFIYAGAFVFLLIRPFAIQTFRIPSGSMWPTLYVNDFIVANKAIYRYTDPQFGDVVVFRPPSAAASPDQIDSNGEVKVDFIKRLVGVPGDVIEVKKGVLYRNGEPVADRFKHFSDTVPGTNNEQFTLKDANEVAQMNLTSFKFVKYQGKLWPLDYSRMDSNPGDDHLSAEHINDGYGFPIAPDYAISDAAVAQQLVNEKPEKIPPGYYFMMGDNRNNSFDGRGWGLVPRASIIGRSEFIWLPLPRWQVTR